MVESGNGVSVTAILEQPLMPGDVLVLAADGEQALELSTDSQPISEVKTILRLQEGKAAAYVIRADGQVHSASRTFRVMVPATEPEESGHAGTTAWVQSFEKRLKVKFFNSMARQGAIREARIRALGGREIVARFSLKVADNPILYLQSTRNFPANMKVTVKVGN